MRAAAPPLRTKSFDSRMPRLPAVKKSPHTRLRATFCPGVGNSYFTLDQSHSSSSAASWARPVSVPCPISERAMRMMTVSSGCTTTQALTSGPPTSACPSFGPKGRSNPSARPPLTAAVPTTNERRLILATQFMSASLSARGRMDCLADLLISTAAADVGDLAVDVLIAGFGLVLQQRRDRHDHSALAVAALRHVVIDPGLLHLVQSAVLGKAFDGGDLLTVGQADRNRA